MDKLWEYLKKEKKTRDLQRDLNEVSDFTTRLTIRLKIFFYFFQRLVADFLLRLFLKGKIENFWFPLVNLFLWREGGLFKEYVYSICAKYRPLRGARVLVPGVGYGGNILQLASFRPQKIFAFDPVDFREEWNWVKSEAQKRFGVEVEFMAGDFDDVPKKFLNSFDFVISDAVLMYVRDCESFLKSSYSFLKKGGVFYTSVGFVWFGVRGDTLPWKGKDLYNHLLLDKKAYENKTTELINSLASDSEKEFFAALVKQKTLSFLSMKEYLEIFESAGFNLKKLFIQIEPEAIFLLRNCPDLKKGLDQKRAPGLDRYCKGFSLWMVK